MKTTNKNRSLAKIKLMKKLIMLSMTLIFLNNNYSYGMETYSEKMDAKNIKKERFDYLSQEAGSYRRFDENTYKKLANSNSNISSFKIFSVIALNV